MGSGLDGVVVADTRLSDVDGERGRLIIAGHDVEQLTGSRTFEELCALLWRGALPSQADRETLRKALATARMHAFERLRPAGRGAPGGGWDGCAARSDWPAPSPWPHGRGALPHAHRRDGGLRRRLGARQAAAGAAGAGPLAHPRGRLPADGARGRTSARRRPRRSTPTSSPSSTTA